MSKVTKTSEIVVSEDLTLQVESLPNEIKGLVALFDEWRQDLEDSRLKHLQVQMALEQLQARIATDVTNFVNKEGSTDADDVTNFVNKEGSTDAESN